jgi:Dual-action HEIGH metallo-peptidase
MVFIYAVLVNTILSCQIQDISAPDEISKEVMDKIAAQGYDTSNFKVHPIAGSYVVENDIFLSYESLNKPSNYKTLRVDKANQYRTTQIVTGLPRVITVSVQNLFPYYTEAADSAIARYNALGLRLTFKRVATNAAITIIGKDLGNASLILGMSNGFPKANGSPADTIFINTRVTFGNIIPEQATFIAHEMGHCIGFRHTDFRNRSFSCGNVSRNPNEGAGSIGAVYIPGTSRGNDDESWMLACNSGVNRPFNYDDIVALKYLYR